LDQDVTVPLAVLAQAAEALLDHVKRTAGETVELPHDFFWAIPPDALYDMHSKPEPLTIGQLTESLAHVERIVQGVDEPLAYGLVWLADLLRAVGAQAVK
jgi:hypothetical protein